MEALEIAMPKVFWDFFTSVNIHISERNLGKSKLEFIPIHRVIDKWTECQIK